MRRELSAEVGDLFRRQPGYLRLLAVRVASQFGDGAFHVGLAGLFFFSPQRATTAEGVAWAIIAGLLPYTLVSPFAGVLLDRWYRRQVILVANLIRVVLVLGTAVCVGTGAPMGWLLVLALLCLGVDRFVLAGLQAALPFVVRRELLVLANSVTPTLGTIVMLLGMAGGFATVQALGSGDRAGAAALLLGAGAYFAAALLGLTFRRRALGPTDPPVPVAFHGAVRNILTGMVGGARHILHREPGRWSFTLIVVLRLGLGTFTIMTILLCRNTFTTDVQAGLNLVALVVGLAGAGTAAASVCTPVGVRLLGARAWVACCLTAAAGIYLTWAFALTQTSFLVLAAPLGLVLQGVKIVVDTTLQVSTEEPFWGRVFSLADVGYNASLIVAALLALVAMPAGGHPVGLLVGLVLCHGGAAVWSGLRRRSLPLPAARSTTP